MMTLVGLALFALALVGFASELLDGPRAETPATGSGDLLLLLCFAVVCAHKLPKYDPHGDLD